MCLSLIFIEIPINSTALINFSACSRDRLQWCLWAGAVHGGRVQHIPDISQDGLRFSQHPGPRVRWRAHTDAHSPSHASRSCRSYSHFHYLHPVPYNAEKGSFPGLIALLRAFPSAGLIVEMSHDRGRRTASAITNNRRHSIPQPQGSSRSTRLSALTKVNLRTQNDY